MSKQQISGSKHNTIKLYNYDRIIFRTFELMKKDLSENNILLIRKLDRVLVNESLSSGDTEYLDEKYEQLQKIDDSEVEIQKKLEVIENLKQAEVGSNARLGECKNAPNDSGKLSDEDESYLQLKIEQYKKIYAIPAKPQKPTTKQAPKIVKKRQRPIDPDAKFCAFCERSIRPERDFSVGALIVLLFIGIISGIIYYFLKSPVCPICKHSQWIIPPDNEHP